MPVFEPAKKLIRQFIMSCRVTLVRGCECLAPGRNILHFPRDAEAQTLPIPAKWYKHQGPAINGPKVRHNQWRYSDYNGDGVLDWSGD